MIKKKGYRFVLLLLSLLFLFLTKDQIIVGFFGDSTTAFVIDRLNCNQTESRSAKRNIKIAANDVEKTLSVSRHECSDIFLGKEIVVYHHNLSHNVYQNRKRIIAESLIIVFVAVAAFVFLVKK